MKSRIIATALILSVPLVLSVLPGTASARENCHNILMDGFYKEYAQSNVQLRDRSMYAELCSIDYPQARKIIKRVQQSGADKTPGLSYGLFNLDEIEVDAGTNSGAQLPDLEVSEEKFGQWKSGYCSKSSPRDSSQAAEFLMQKTAARNRGPVTTAVEAWGACMKKQEGLTCWAAPADASNPEGSETVLLNVNWTSTASAQSQAQPEVEYSFLTRGGVSKFEGAPPKRVLPTGYKLRPGVLQIPVTRPADSGLFASVKVIHGGLEHSCKVFFPGERDFTLSAPFLNRLKFRYPG